MIDWTDDQCRAFAQAHDREQAAMMGEPDPWAAEPEPEWEADRIACVREGLAAIATREPTP